MVPGFFCARAQAQEKAFSLSYAPITLQRPLSLSLLITLYPYHRAAPLASPLAYELVC
jgi:hypothetical protein